jgi:hypothetical protein
VALPGADLVHERHLITELRNALAITRRAPRRRRLHRAATATVDRIGISVRDIRRFHESRASTMLSMAYTT